MSASLRNLEMVAKSLGISMPEHFKAYEIEAVAIAIYMANHKGPFGLPNNRTSPIWENLSEEVRDWVRQQAKLAISMTDYVRAHPEYLDRIEESYLLYSRDRLAS